MGLFSKKKTVPLVRSDYSIQFRWFCCKCAEVQGEWQERILLTEHLMCTMKCKAPCKERIVDPNCPGGGRRANHSEPTIREVPGKTCDHVPYYCTTCIKAIVRLIFSREFLKTETV